MEYKKDSIIVGIASQKSREKQLKKTVESLLSQCHFMHVYLNDYDSIPEFLQNDRILIFDANNGDLKDVGKFYDIPKDVYYFTADDDIIYPPDYIKKTVEFLKHKQNKCIATYHGRILRPMQKNYYLDCDTIFQFQNTETETKQINIAGTGVMAYHTSLIEIDINELKPCMTDITFSIICHSQNIPIFHVEHKQGWLLPQKVKESISKTYGKNDKEQTLLINSINWSFPQIELKRNMYEFNAIKQRAKNKLAELRKRKEIVIFQYKTGTTKTLYRYIAESQERQGLGAIKN